MKYPPPSHAATIWWAAGRCWVSLDGHALAIDPADRGAWDRLAETLEHRAVAGRPRIGQPASPTQHQFDLGDARIRKHYRSGEAMEDLEIE